MCNLFYFTCMCTMIILICSYPTASPHSGSSSVKPCLTPAHPRPSPVSLQLILGPTLPHSSSSSALAILRPHSSSSSAPATLRPHSSLSYSPSHSCLTSAQLGSVHLISAPQQLSLVRIAKKVFLHFTGTLPQ